MTLFLVSPTKASHQMLQHTKQQDEQSVWAAYCTHLLEFCVHFQMVLSKRLAPSCHTCRPIEEKTVFPSNSTCTLLFYRRIHQSLSSERILIWGTMCHGVPVSFSSVFQGNKCPSFLWQSGSSHCKGNTCWTEQSTLSGLEPMLKNGLIRRMANCTTV